VSSESVAGPQRRQRGACARRGDSERCQSTRVRERDSRPVSEVEDGTRVPRRGLARGSHDPVSGHPEVDVHDRSVVERQELVLPAALDAIDSAPAKRVDGRLLDRAPQGGVQESNLGNALSDRGARECTRGGLHLWQLRHAPLRMS
jgi:hypothetical protein